MMLSTLFVVLSIVNICYSNEKPEDSYLNFIDSMDPLEMPFYRDVLAKIYENSSINEIERRIIGGEIAFAGQFPYTVGLHMRSMLNMFVCGGSLIKFNWVLTAAHCIYDFSRITVIVGSINRIRGPAAFTQDVTLSRHIISHPLYNPQTLKNDIGLIFLSSSREWLLNHQFVSLISLPLESDAEINLIGRNSTVSGFGTTTDGENRQPSEVLRFVSVPIMSNEECARTFGSNVRSSNLCVDTTGGRSACSGDSGGPLTVEIEPGRSVVVGVVSFGHVRGCGLGYPAVFARVTSYLQWIDAVTSTGSKIELKILILMILFFIFKLK